MTGSVIVHHSRKQTNNKQTLLVLLLAQSLSCSSVLCIYLHSLTVSSATLNKGRHAAPTVTPQLISTLVASR